MAKPIRFSLEMEKGVKVNTLEELREHFDLEKILGYYIDGKLLTWLKGRYHASEVDQIAGLDRNDAEFNRRLCDILGVKCENPETVNIVQLDANKRRVAQLKQYTDDEEIVRNIDKVAFEQQELDTLVKNHSNEIYLCGNTFSISLDYENVSYIGINKPEVQLPASHDINFDKMNIYFTNVHLTSKVEMKIIVRESQQVSIDSNKIKTDLIFKSLITTFNIDSGGRRYTKIYLYKTYLIHVLEQSRDFVFDIFDINTKQKLISVSNIKPEPVMKYKPHYIEQTNIYKNYLIIFWGNDRNLSLQLFNLDTLKVESTIPLPRDYPRNVTQCSFIEVHENQIGLYSNFADYTMSCQYHSIPSLELVSSKFFRRDPRHNRGCFEAVYHGEAFLLDSRNMTIISTQKTGVCEKLRYNNQPVWDIEIFKIRNNKIYVVHRVGTTERKEIVNIADIRVFSLVGGEQIGEAQVKGVIYAGFNPSELRYTNLVDILYIDKMLVVIPESVPEIYFYDETSLGLKNKFSLDLSLGQWGKPSDFCGESCEIYGTYIDSESHRMAIAYNGIIAIYE